jgi:hypothetical protein
MRLNLSLFSNYAKAIWLCVATSTVLSEVLPAPHIDPWIFYGLYTPGKLLFFVCLSFLTPLAFANFADLNRGIAFAVSSATLIELLQGLLSNGHSFHWYELLIKLVLLLFGFGLGLDARGEQVISFWFVRISLLANDVAGGVPVDGTVVPNMGAVIKNSGAELETPLRGK